MFPSHVIHKSNHEGAKPPNCISCAHIVLGYPIAPLNALGHGRATRLQEIEARDRLVANCLRRRCFANGSLSR